MLHICKGECNIVVNKSNNQIAKKSIKNNAKLKIPSFPSKTIALTTHKKNQEYNVAAAKTNYPLSIILFLAILSVCLFIIYQLVMRYVKGEQFSIKWLDDLISRFSGWEFKMSVYVIVFLIFTSSTIFLIFGALSGFTNISFGLHLISYSFSGFVAVGTIALAISTYYLSLSRTSLKLLASSLKYEINEFKKDFECLNIDRQIYIYGFPTGRIGSTKYQSLYFLPFDLYIQNEVAMGLGLPQGIKEKEAKDKDNFIIFLSNKQKESDYYSKKIKYNYSNQYEQNLKNNKLTTLIRDKYLREEIIDLYASIYEFTKNLEDYILFYISKKNEISSIIQTIKNREPIDSPIYDIIPELKRKSGNLYKLYKEFFEKYRAIDEKLSIIING